MGAEELSSGYHSVCSARGFLTVEKGLQQTGRMNQELLEARGQVTTGVWWMLSNPDYKGNSVKLIVQLANGVGEGIDLWDVCSLLLIPCWVVWGCGTGEGIQASLH